MQRNAVLLEAVAEFAQRVGWGVSQGSLPALPREVLEDVEEQAQEEGREDQED